MSCFSGPDPPREKRKADSHGPPFGTQTSGNSQQLRLQLHVARLADAVDVAESGSKGQSWETSPAIPCTHPRSFCLLTPLLSTPSSHHPKCQTWRCITTGTSDTYTCRASPQGRLPGASTGSALSGFGCQTCLHKPRHRKKDRGVRARLHHADDLQLLGGREVRHHRRLLDTRENQAFLNKSSLQTSCNFATEAEQLARNSDDCGAANSTVHNSPFCK